MTENLCFLSILLLHVLLHDKKLPFILPTFSPPLYNQQCFDIKLVNPPNTSLMHVIFSTSMSSEVMHIRTLHRLSSSLIFTRLITLSITCYKLHKLKLQKVIEWLAFVPILLSVFLVILLYFFFLLPFSTFFWSLSFWGNL